MRWPFVSRRRYEDALLDADRKVNQLDRAARTYLAERDNLRAEIATLRKSD